jgi:hypothetical protein
MDYFTQPLAKTKLIERYLKCTALPKINADIENEKWKKIED